MTNKEAIDKLTTLKIAQALQAKAFSEDGKPLESDFETAVNMTIEELEKADTYKRVVVANANGEEFSVLVDTKRRLVYSACVPLAFYKATGLIVIGEEGENE